MSPQRAALLTMVTAVLMSGCHAPMARPNASDVIRSTFEERSSRSLRGDQQQVAEVVSLDAGGVSWRPVGGAETTRSLRFADLVSVEWQHLDEYPARPTNVYLYLDPLSPSVASAATEKPLLSEAGVSLPYVILAERPHGAGAQLRRAIMSVMAGLEECTPSPASPPAAPTTVNAQSTSLPATDEERLRSLKRWHAEGLISDDEYAEAKRRVLEGTR